MTIFAEPTSVVQVSVDTARAAARSAAGESGPGPVPSGGSIGSVTTEQLLRARAAFPSGDPHGAALRARVIEDNLPMANWLARRYAGRGERFEDLAQVAALALVVAVDGYDSGRFTPFVSYAVPTIVGALKRHFRDTAWGMRVPRSIQQLTLELAAATGHLTQQYGRSPTTAELADHLQVSVGDLLTAADASQVYRLPSLNAPIPRGDGNEVIDLVGTIDLRYVGLEDHLTLGTLVLALPLRDRRILTMRFYDEMTQARIAAEVGLS